jgi:chromosome segregation ATPase
MIESIMYFAMGFLFAGLSILVVVPLVHGRAVRLTARRLTKTLPSSIVENNAQKDLLRAEFARGTRILEIKIEQLQNNKASQLAELGKKRDAVNRLQTELSALRDRLVTTEETVAVKAAAMQEAESALSDKESKLASLMYELDQQSTITDAQKIEIAALKAEVEGKTAAMQEAESALSDKESKLASLMYELNQQSTFTDAQKIEIAALDKQVDLMKKQLNGLTEKLRAVEDCRDAERIDLQAATQELMEERSKFEIFHARVADLVRQVMAQTTDHHCAQEALESRLYEQARQLNEREFELQQMRSEIEIVRKAEADLQVALKEIDAREKGATQNIKAETAKLKAALDRATYLASECLFCRPPRRPSGRAACPEVSPDRLRVILSAALGPVLRSGRCQRLLIHPTDPSCRAAVSTVALPLPRRCPPRLQKIGVALFSSTPSSAR